jgi:putative FmdB family regulatory protein
MPTYEYACKSCGEHVEVVQSFKDEPLTTCPACGGPLRKVFGSIGIAFKGSGFYKTDSRRAAESKSGESKSAESKSGEGKSGDSASGGDSGSRRDSGSSDKPGSSGAGKSDASSPSGSSGGKLPASGQAAS